MHIAQCMRAQIKVPLLQGCLQYAYKSDVSSSYKTDDSALSKFVTLL